MLNQNNGGSYNLNIFDSPEKAASSLARKIIDQSLEIIKKKGQCVWAVSGGSTILKFYDAMAANHEILKELSSNLTVIWVDERVVPHSDKNSNFGNAYNYFWSDYEGAQLIPVPYNEIAEQAAEQYNSILYEKGIESGDIDIIILGMGSDGHTASLFPHNRTLNEKNKNVIAVEDSSVQLRRVSISYPFINSSDHIYLFFYGDEKAQTFRQAIRSGSVDEYPILGIKKEKLNIYTDQNPAL